MPTEQSFALLIIGPPGTGNTFGQVDALINNSLKALRAGFRGQNPPNAPVVGQHWEKEDANGILVKTYKYTGDNTIVTDGYTGWDEGVAGSKGIGLEVKTARGAKASLNERISVLLDANGKLIITGVNDSAIPET
ncbi:MAG: hypothetical protein M1510_10685, partial [Nitrospirae bacterium]|nr:hypothetical protein [Nitrospirota bacterium]